MLSTAKLKEHNVTSSETANVSAAQSQRFAILFEVAAFVIFALVSKAVVANLTWQYSGPITLIGTLIILTLYMKKKGLSWREFGLKPLPGLKAKFMILPQALLVFLAFAAAVGPILAIAEAYQISFLLEVDDGVEKRFGEVKDNLPMLLLWLGIVWTSAAFGEEMFFRGYLVTRLQQAFSGSFFSSQIFATLLAILIPALIFGYGHMNYQGLRGLIVTGAIGIAFGCMYLLFKKNLWPIILVHGVVDTLGFVSVYLGQE